MIWGVEEIRKLRRETAERYSNMTEAEAKADFDKHVQNAFATMKAIRDGEIAVDLPKELQELYDMAQAKQTAPVESEQAQSAL